MPQTPEKPRPKHRWTYEEYYRMVDAGVFREQHVELIDGQILRTTPQDEAHVVGILLVNRTLSRAFGTGYVLRQKMGLRTGVDEEPEPDIAVVAGEIRDTLTTGRPRSALLVVEVSGASLNFDLGQKAEIYAGAGIEEYWVLDLESRLLRVHRNTIPDASLPRGRRYSKIEVLDESASVSPLSMPDRPIRVADLLP
jgi:Uma2 family endonuclease